MFTVHTAKGFALMAKNSLKDLRERRAAEALKMKDAHEKLKVNRDDKDARSAFDTSGAAIEALDKDIADEERIAQVQRESALLGGPGSEDRNFGLNTPKDDPIANVNGGKYSLLRAIDSLAEGREVKGLEGEVSQELAKRFGKTAAGFLIPLNLRMDATPNAERRALDLTDGAGALTVTQAPTLIEALRKRIVTAQMGATVMSDMVGTFEMPKVTGQPTFGWLGEGDNASASNSTVGKVTFAPTTVAAYSVVGRRLRKQTSIDAENFQRMELMKSLALAADFGALAGSGSSNQPTGIIYNTNCNTIALGTNGAALAWADLVNFETLVADDNADIDQMGYVFNAVTRGKLKTTVKVSGYPVYLWENGETPVNGYRAMVSNQLPKNLTKGTASGVCSSAIFGSFSNLIMAFWGGADVLVDPYSGGLAGDVRVIVHQDMQVKNRYDEAFTRCIDILTA